MNHPSDADIRTWLDSGLPPELDDHIGTCDICTDAADRLSEETFGGRVRAFLAAPEGFEQRIAKRVDTALSRWEAAEALAELFSVGVQTVGLMIGEEDDEQ